jgi:hypothetical protein
LATGRIAVPQGFGSGSRRNNGMAKLNWSKQYKNAPNGARLSRSSSGPPLGRRGVRVSFAGGAAQAGVNLASKERLLIIENAQGEQVLPWPVARAALSVLAEDGAIAIDRAGRPLSATIDGAHLQSKSGSVNLHGHWSIVPGPTPFFFYSESMGDTRVSIPLRVLVSAARHVPGDDARVDRSLRTAR